MLGRHSNLNQLNLQQNILTHFTAMSWPRKWFCVRFKLTHLSACPYYLPLLTTRHSDQFYSHEQASRFQGVSLKIYSSLHSRKQWYLEAVTYRSIIKLKRTCRAELGVFSKEPSNDNRIPSTSWGALCWLWWFSHVIHGFRTKTFPIYNHISAYLRFTSPLISISNLHTPHLQIW
jgi:hypothetical protein